MAGLGYPGGPIVDRLARRGRAARPFPLPQFKDGSSDLSFSGLKTAVKDRLGALGLDPLVGIPEARRLVAEADATPELCDLLADFQEAVVTQIEDRLTRLNGRGRFALLTVSGGVAANSLLRERLTAWGRSRGVETLLPYRSFTGDNAAMVAFAGLMRFRRSGAGEGFDALARSRWPLEELPR
jgi:N6-L-threonylcarbamoyladenine synthase